ncbi:hypothetical protein BVC80_7895g2 [Macleaya cordata]|uniref:Uncharacterized protein n=1 Tax=Macleaya cordata TaxID=56857 RepID=A0A200R8P8_MACCD|nr:hypothetical protein BVC80_7895g2 [Macleaya cordata]
MEVGSSSSTTTTTSSWTSATNWIVKNGSLNNSLSFETPFSEINEESNSPKDQLQLIKPISPDSGPCEITISFSQKHEIQQIYVRSTARVYEIYYAPDQKSSNEYLCTVRCSAAAKEDAARNASDSGEANGLYPEGSSGTMELCVDNIKNDNRHGTNEDDWVEVKVPVSPLLDNSVPTKVNRNTGRSTQDSYEATAEITDADPCISITLRLLSLQTQGCVYLEEIYIFGEPVEPSDSDHQVGPLQNSAGSSLMSMLVPTLLQLSKSRTQEKNASDTREDLKYQDGKFKETESLNPEIGRTKQQEAQSSIQDEGETKLEEVAKGSADLTQLESAKHVPGTGQGPVFVTKENDQSYGCIERVLDHLVSRVGRIEAFCLRFEEKMLGPISSIETRLERLEKQVEVLNMRPQFSEFNPGTRITAPEFSCSESLSNSFHNDGNNPCTRFTAPEFSCSESLSNSLHNDENDEHFPKGSEYAVKDTPCTRIRDPEFLGNESESNSLDNDGIDDHNSRGLEYVADKNTHVGEPSSPVRDASVSSVFPQMCPGLVIRAPEFPSDNDGEDEGGEDGEDMNCTEVFESAEKTCSIGKKSVSIDDALASALAGFLSTTSVQSPKVTQTFKVRTPDIVNEDHNDNNKSKSPSTNPYEESAADAGIFCDGSNSSEHVSPSDSTSCCSSRENELQVMKLRSEIPDLIPEQTAIYEDWFTNPAYEREIGTDNRTQLEMQLFAEKNYDEIADKTISGTIIACHDLTSATEVQNPDYKISDSENVLERTYSSVVDFELPILDVTFVPQGNLNAKSPLEALLDDKPESNIEDSCVKGEDDDGVKSVEQSHLISVEDDKLQIPTSDDKLLLVGIDDLTVESVIPNKETEHVEDSSVCKGDKSFSSLI